MFGKSVKDLLYEDILDLVQVRELGEGLHLDYKEFIGRGDIVFMMITAFRTST